MSIEAPERTKTPTEATRPVQQPERRDDLPRKATAAGSGDPYCHWYVNRSRTLCGISHEPLEFGSFHREAPCPNGNPPCPACIQAYRNGGQGGQAA